MAKEKKPGETKLKNPKHELFAWLYAGYHNRNLFGNGRACYMQAYGYNDEVVKLRQQIDELIDKKEKGYTVQVSLRERRVKSRENVAAVEANRILNIPKVLRRVDHLMDELMTNDFMDRELVYTAGQRFDLNAKIAALREWNRMKDRSSEKLDATIEYRWADPEGSPARK